MLPNTVSENRQWDRYPTRLRIGHIKLTHGHYMSSEQPPTCEDCGEDTPLTIKHIITKRPSLNNRKRQFFGSTNKTMKQLLNDGDITYGDTLYKVLINIDLPTKLRITDNSTLNNYNSEKKINRKTPYRSQSKFMTGW